MLGVPLHFTKNFIVYIFNYNASLNSHPTYIPCSFSSCTSLFCAAPGEHPKNLLHGDMKTPRVPTKSQAQASELDTTLVST